MKRFTGLLVFAFTLASIETAEAYVGPGAGLSLVGALIGLVLTVLTALFFVLSWPIRRLLQKRSGNVEAPSGAHLDASPERSSRDPA